MQDKTKQCRYNTTMLPSIVRNIPYRKETESTKYQSRVIKGKFDGKNSY